MENPNSPVANEQYIPDPNTGAVGLVIADFDFGLAIMKPTNPLDFAKHFALSATANSISLEGIDGVTVEATNLKVEVNQSSPSAYGVPFFPVVDFANTPEFASEQLPLFDTNGNGKISPAEFDALMTSGEPPPLGDMSEHERLLAMLDADDDGVIDLDEAAAGLGGGAAALEKVKRADANGNGIIDPLGFGVNTGTGNPPVYLSMDSPLVRAQGSLFLDVAGVVALAGNFAFELGPTQDMKIAHDDHRRLQRVWIHRLDR
jgi:hypothetical protein